MCVRASTQLPSVHILPPPSLPILSSPAGIHTWVMGLLRSDAKARKEGGVEAGKTRDTKRKWGSSGWQQVIRYSKRSTLTSDIYMSHMQKHVNSWFNGDSLDEVHGRFVKTVVTYYFHLRHYRQTNLTLFLSDYHGNEWAIQEQKAPFAVGTVWKKPVASAHVKAGRRWELEKTR